MTFYDPVNDVARGERAIVVVPERVGEGARRSTEARLDEAEGLAGAIGVDVVARKAFRLRQVRPATLLGKGQVEEIDRVYRAYPHLNDDEFVQQGRDEWLNS